MSRRRAIETAPSDEDRAAALRRARALLRYVLAREVEATRKDRLATMGPTGLRAVLDEEERDGPRSLGKAIRESLAVADRDKASLRADFRANRHRG